MTALVIAEKIVLPLALLLWLALLPPGSLIGFALPTAGGMAGRTTLVNGHMRTLRASVEVSARGAGSPAVDFFGLGPFGLRTSSSRPADPAVYAIFGAAVHAPCDGA